MKRIFMTFLWWGLTVAALAGQSIRHRAVKCEVSALRQNRLQIALELFHHRQTGLEFQVAYEHYNNADGVPSGGLIQTNRYGQERLDTFYNGTNKLVSTSDWYAYDEHKPLADLPPNLPKSSWEFSVFYRSNFRKIGSPWTLSIKPGVFATFHQYFSNKSKNFRYQHTETVYFDEISPTHYQVRQTIELWRQEREILPKRHQQVGIAFQCSLSRQISKFCLIEAGLDGRITFGSAPYENPVPHKILRSAACRPVLNLGWTF